MAVVALQLKLLKKRALPNLHTDIGILSTIKNMINYLCESAGVSRFVLFFTFVILSCSIYILLNSITPII